MKVALLLHPAEHAGHVVEHGLVPGEVAPLVLLHPVAVEVEHVQGDFPLGHAVHKAAHGLLVVAGGEAGGQPQAEAPGGGQGGPAGEGGVVGEDGLAVAAAHHHEVDLLAGHGELHPGDGLGANLVGDLAAGVHQHAVALVGHVEGDVLVGDFGAGAAVLVPDVHGLAVAHKGGEALAQAVDLLADVQIHLHPHEGAFGSGQGADHGVAKAVADVGQLFAVVVIGEGGGVLGDAQLGFAAGNGQAALKLGDSQGAGFRVQLELGLLFGAAHKVVGLGAQDVLLGGGDGHLQHRAAHGAHVLGIGHGVQVDAVGPHFHFADLHRVGVFHAGLVQPVAIGKFHGYHSFLMRMRFRFSDLRFFPSIPAGELQIPPGCYIVYLF